MPKTPKVAKRVKRIAAEYGAPITLYVSTPEQRKTGEWTFAGGFITVKRAIQEVERNYKTVYTKILGLMGGTKFQSNPWSAYKVKERPMSPYGGERTKVWGIGPSSLYVIERLPTPSVSRKASSISRKSPRITPKVGRLR